MINSEIKDIIKVHDYWQIITDKVIINIYNPYIISNKIGENLKQPYEDLINIKIKNITYKDNVEYCIELFDGYCIKILLDNDSYVGSEALEICSNDSEFIMVE
jgi:hypothetical protein